MSKTVQFRCPDCKRLVLKVDTGRGAIVYKDPEIQFNDKTKTVACSKCGKVSKLIPEGLV